MTLAYKVEYETTDISLPSLLAKYSLNIEDLEGCTEWTKHPRQQQLVTKPQTQPQLVVHSTEKMLEDINSFKVDAIAYAKKFMKTNVHYCEIKEFKDIVGVMTSLEASLKETKPQDSTTYNILVQQVVASFKDDV